MGTVQLASRELEAAGSCKNSLGVRPKARGWSWHVCLFLHRLRGHCQQSAWTHLFKGWESRITPLPVYWLNWSVTFLPTHSRRGRGSSIITVVTRKFLEEMHRCHTRLWQHAIEKVTANIFCKEANSKYLSFEGCTVSGETTQLCGCRLKATTDNM